VSGQIDATSSALPGTTHLPLPRAGVVSPLGHSTPFVRHGLDWLETGEEPIANAFSATLRNLSAARLDAARMALDLGDPVTGTVTTDGATTLRLASVDTPVTVTVDGTPAGSSHNGVVVVDLGAGDHTVTLQPAD
jgi:hypothetical protein